MKKKTPTVHELRKQGYKVMVRHRRYENASTNFFTVKSQTTVVITTPDGRTAEGDAFCGYTDQFNRKLGTRIALGRALKNLRLENYIEFEV